MSEGRSVRHGLTSPAHVIGRPAAAALAALVTLLPGLAVELAARCKDRRPMAATDKCLAQMNKSGDGVKATKGHQPEVTRRDSAEK